MSYIQTFSTDESMELDEFMEFADSKIDMRDKDSLFSLGEQLSMLGNNRTFLSRFLCEYIKQCFGPTPPSTLVSQSVVLARGRDCYIRANFWPTAEEMTPSEAALFAYFQPHDHNFDLLSYAYSGSGYTTELYEYDYDEVMGYIGEEVRLVPKGSYTHKCGDVILYERNRDVHSQLPPLRPSITLNLLPTHTTGGLYDQYFFDIDAADPTRARLATYAQSNIEGRRRVFEMVQNFSDPNVIDVLSQFAISYPCRRTRYHALQALSVVDKAVHDAVCERLRSDTTPLIRHYIGSQILG